MLDGAISHLDTGDGVALISSDLHSTGSGVASHIATILLFVYLDGCDVIVLAGPLKVPPLPEDGYLPCGS